MAETRQKRNQKAYQDINGLFIYHDDKNRIIYAPAFSRVGYLIPKSQIHEFYRYTQRTTVSVFVGLGAVALFQINVFDGFLIGLVLYIVWTCVFSFRFLNRCTTIEHFKRIKKESYFLALSKRYTRGTFAGLITLSLFFAAILGLYILSQPLEPADFATKIILMTGVSLFAAVHLIGLIIQLKNSARPEN